ncbi:ATP-dependent helicase [Desulfobacter hydrogenophilus]|uniref:ATP-dependent RNA helicase DeaD n=1 Tax=Desulfobacter hydrogenophilus TaxID=2291 RepID=A0A328FEK2_9BACT|nr:DEAD/DEAH box helicase [Desulfobacter hydrogenophilus]NDY73573.1 DEAD/DEAH box helicase [Desulfobacter hydrogenophilus]QBH13667.1 DEAD/DEAH box helicase [Desulfobacter hydrogenophilus]RAM01852.1 ATP-dependent helicase [Desulfobacter hydrogenophilus]
MPHKNLEQAGFDEMNLSPDVFAALQTVGYETPTPIQTKTIPHMIACKDLLGQARTGTGKTAAFALPLLSRINLKNRHPQVLVVTPTRELAIQVAQSFSDYGVKMKGLNVLAVYGGQSYGVQLSQLKRGVHVIVGTPGRLMDHMRRKTVCLDDLTGLVLDEADEMLQMGFIDDVEWILSQIPQSTQIALFSATMPAPIQKIAGKYLKNPEKVIIRHDSDVTSTIQQKFWLVKHVKKSHALVRILEASSHDGVIVFTKTRNDTMGLTKILEEKGFKAEALNGDIAQAARERTVNRLKNGNIDILVATDVAARGLDVDRISHVINYDMPPKTEPYIHRIGRTGRAGRSGEAILFVQPKERWMLKRIENATRRKVEEIALPSNREINKKRMDDFKNKITQTIGTEDLSAFTDLVETTAKEQDVPIAQVAAALAKMLQGNTPFLLKETAEKPAAKKTAKKPEKKAKAPVAPRQKQTPDRLRPNKISPTEEGMERYRIEVGYKHGLKPGDVVGAISNESGLESSFIGNINIDYDYSLVDLPFGMPKNVFNLLKGTWIRSQKMSISKYAC